MLELSVQEKAEQDDRIIKDLLYASKWALESLVDAGDGETDLAHVLRHAIKQAINR